MSVDLTNERSAVEVESPAVSTAAKPKTRRTFAHEVERRIIATFLAFVVYVLAIGPLYWWYYDAKFNEGPTVLAAFYEPLYVLCSWVRPFGRLVDAYVQLWIG